MPFRKRIALWIAGYSLAWLYVPSSSWPWWYCFIAGPLFALAVTRLEGEA